MTLCTYAVGIIRATEHCVPPRAHCTMSLFHNLEKIWQGAQQPWGHGNSVSPLTTGMLIIQHCRPMHINDNTTHHSYGIS